MTTPNSASVRAQLQRGREVWESRQEQDRAEEAQRRKALMKTRETAIGDRVSRFPSTETLLSEVEELREALADLYDLAAAMKNRDDQIAEHAKPDAARFPALEAN